MPGREQLQSCLASLLEACAAAEPELSRLREAIGKHRGKGSGMARLLRAAAAELSQALQPCLEACILPETPWDLARCSLAEAAERHARGLAGAATRLQQLPRLTGETEERLARAAIEAAASCLEALCEAARTAERMLEALR